MIHVSTSPRPALVRPRGSSPPRLGRLLTLRSLIAEHERQRESHSETIRNLETTYEQEKAMLLREIRQSAHKPVAWRTNAEGRCVWVSDEFCELTGFEDTAQVLELRWHDFISPEDSVRMGAQFFNCVQTGRPFDCSYSIRSRDGWLRVMALSEVVRDSSGKYAGFEGVLIPIK